MEVIHSSTEFEANTSKLGKAKWIRRKNKAMNNKEIN